MIKPTVVIIDEELPYPLNSGKRIRSFNLITRLANTFHIIYVCYCNPDPIESQRAEKIFRLMGIETLIIPRTPLPKNGPRFAARLLANCASPYPYSVSSHQSNALQKAILSISKVRSIALWQAEWTPYLEPLLKSCVTPCTLVAHNVESVIWRRYRDHEANVLRRFFLHEQYRKYHEYEKKVFQCVSQVIAVSDHDADLIKKGFSVKDVTTVENGVDVHSFRNVKSTQRNQGVLFLGSLDWRPNIDAINQLIEKIWPLVREMVPSARLQIVGRKASQELKKRCSTISDIDLHCDVDDVREYLWTCNVMVVPLRIGGGSRLKILEALAAGLPVVSTCTGAEGLFIENSHEVIIRNNPRDTADALAGILNNNINCDNMVEAGHDVVQKKYDWDYLSQKLGTVWNQVIEKNHSNQLNVTNYIK